MAKYKSKFAKLSFYCCNERKQFNGGVYETNKKCEIEVLDKITDAVRIDEPKPEPKEPPKVAPKAEEPKSAPKKATARKPSAK